MTRPCRADPTLQGMISGLTLGDTLAVVYLATLQAIALGTRHIISEMNKVRTEQYFVNYFCFI